MSSKKALNYTVKK
jgi:peptide chain release factor 2